MASGKPLRYPVLAACCYSMMAVSFVNAAHAFLLPDIAGALGMGDARSGLFLSCALSGMVVAILVAGPLADRFGFRMVFVAAAALQAAGLLMVAHAQGIPSAIAGACVGGLGTGAALNLTTPVAFLLFPRRRAAICNFIQSFCSVGAVIIVVLALVLLRMQWSWRAIYRADAVLVLAYGVAFLLLPLPASRPQDVERTPVGRLLRSGPFLLALLAMSVIAFTTAGVGLWLPTYVGKVVSGSRGTGAAGMVLFSTAGAVGNWLNAALLERLGPRRLVVIGGLLSLGAILGGVATANPIVAISCFALLMLGMVGMGPILLGDCGDRFPAGGATMYSLIFAFGNGACAVSPLVIGLLAGLWGLRLAIAALAVGPAAAVLLLLMLLPRDRAASFSAAPDGLGS